MSGHFLDRTIEEKTVEIFALKDIIARYEAALRKIAWESSDHFSVSIAQAAYDGWDARVKMK